MTEHYDVLVVGAGPAGLATAQAAAGHGARVGVIDAQPRPGGQVWRHDVRQASPHAARHAFAALARVEWLARHSVVGAETQVLRVEHPDGVRLLGYGALVLATGARELMLPFPGWTLPGVSGAGGLQALAKQGWPVAGKRVLVSGTGPLLLAAAATLRAHGAHLLGIHEQAPTAAVHAFARQMLHWPARAVQAISLRTRLAGVAYRCGSFVRRANGDDRLQSVDIEGPDGAQQVECDLLATGYGLVPNVELAQLLGCALAAHDTHPHVQVDALSRTSVAGIHAAGELCGIGGLAAARIEGAIAGHMAAGDLTAASALLPARARARRFAGLLSTHFALDPRLRTLATPQTTICRCEDVTLGELGGYTDARDAKLATRCGMGACQGRICGSALAELGRFPRSGPRPPLFPARLATLAEASPPLSD
ncbi:FAD-dependent oxidoreductase [Rhodanobacter sp. 7MK24]|uniref:FAD/NAD(P)-dependent oxidoreductase n=1 Tax=Rhodanobacter sp. 7MK24 TaxID=2775922 RepID=UPI00177CAE67|nr:NAD(P)/FAD-dependent oxidoreductase [Rhodanobacter sp. 7MK24]MBD8878990.1 FAD-dependent oxidoreductase [Rhodanobacter sp. 7MK24]